VRLSPSSLQDGSHGIIAPDAVGARFTLERRSPAPALADRVARHWIVRWDLRGQAPFTQEILPHPCVQVAFQEGRGGVFGMVPGRDARTIAGAGFVYGTKLRPGAFAALTPLPMDQVVGRTLTLTDAFGPDGARLERAVAGLDEDAHYAEVERFLLARVPDEEDPAFTLVSAVIEDLLRCPPDLRIDALAAAHGVSTRSLQRAFRTLVGVGPKWVLQRYRLHEAAERIATGEGDDLTALALDLGYFDLAHFTGRFTAAMGEPPGRYAARCRGMRAQAA